MALCRHGSLFCCFWQIRILGIWDQYSTDTVLSGWRRCVHALVRLSEDVLVGDPSEAWMGIAHVLAPIGSGLGDGY